MTNTPVSATETPKTVPQSAPTPVQPNQGGPKPADKPAVAK